MGSSVTDDHEHRPVWVHLLGCAEEAHAVVGDEICEVILEEGETGGWRGLWDLDCVPYVPCAMLGLRDRAMTLP